MKISLFFEDCRMSFIEVLSAIKEVLVSVAAIVTAIVAYKGLKSWRHELKGKAEFEAARKLARAMYNLRDSLHVCRSPFYTLDEFPKDYPKLDSNGYKPDGWAYVYRNRFSPVWATVQEFDSHVLEAEALWGSEIRAKTEQIQACVRELNAAMNADIENRRSQGEDFKYDPEFGRRVKGIVTVYPNDENDEFSERIRAAIKEIEGLILPHLRR